jgi:hypothetical protein
VGKKKPLARLSPSLLSINPLVPAPSALPEPLASRTCAEDHDDDDFRRVVRPCTVILGPRACMGVILVKSGERQVRLPIWVFARPLQGELGTYLITALPPRAGVDDV